MSVGRLRDWWAGFDKFGRKFMNRANPILGAHEQSILAELQRKKDGESGERE